MSDKITISLSRESAQLILRSVEINSWNFPDAYDDDKMQAIEDELRAALSAQDDGWEWVMDIGEYDYENGFTYKDVRYRRPTPRTEKQKLGTCDPRECICDPNDDPPVDCPHPRTEDKT